MHLHSYLLTHTHTQFSKFNAYCKTKIHCNQMKPHEKMLGRNPLSDAPYRNLGMVLNGQGPGRHPLGDAQYLDLDTMLNEQGSGRRILSDAIHHRPGVVKNE
jgi:hypothetical protein